MKSFNLKRWLLSGLAVLAIGVSSAAAQTPAPIYTKNLALRLPVQLDERSRAEVSEVKLYVRGPAGKWECVQTTLPTQSAFDYRAPMDGEYRFTFVTVDRRGNAQPRNVETVPPHRVVVVDSTPPEVSAEPRAMKGGTFLQCQVLDANPDWTTMRAMYLAPDKTWQPLLPAAADSPTLFRVPSTAVLQNKIQVTIADRAGNRTTRDIDLGSPAAPAPAPETLPLDNGRPDPALLPIDTDPIVTPPPPIRGAGADLPKAPKPEMPSMPALPDIPLIKAPDASPEIKLPDPPMMRRQDAPAVTIPIDPPPVKMPETRPPVEPNKLPDVPNIVPPGLPPMIDVPPPPVVPAARNTSSALKPAEPASPAKLPDPYAAEITPGAHRILNTRSCSINYLAEGGARLTDRVDFWASADAGRTWTKIEDASRGVSPAKLTMPSDGVFGIRIRPGGGSRAPEPGEEPDCVVEIDTTNPAVNLLPPSFGTDEGTMILTWTAADTNLLSNSINLYYATKPTGPWVVIVSGYKNEGVYRWALPTDVKGPVYLRLEAVDRAGNIGRVELPTPVALELGKQRVKVIGVGPGN